MPIPDYQTLMRPLLEVIKDGKEYKVRDLYDQLAIQFSLSSQELKELLPSGQQPIFYNRVGWAKTYLKKAGLIDSPRRASIKITQRGVDLLNHDHSPINVQTLKQYDEFITFQNTKRTEGKLNEHDEEFDKTPEEIIETEYQKIIDSLGSELIEKIIDLSPTFFEQLVVDLIVKMGYGGSRAEAGKAIGKSGDEGIDGVIKEDILGLDIIYLQAKRWQPGNVVGRPEIQKFVGALAGQGAKKGIFITTSSFTKDAIEYQPRNETKIILIDGMRLSKLMIEYNLGVATINNIEIKRIDLDYFEND